MGSGIGTQGLAVGAAISVVSCLVYSWGSHETVRLMPGRSALARTSVTLTGAMLMTCAMGALAILSGRAVLPAVG